jgi:hypothetical protein
MDRQFTWNKDKQDTMGCKSDGDEQQTFMALHNQSLLQAYISE